MNILLWLLQILAALMYAASGIMKVFMFDQISGEVPSSIVMSIVLGLLMAFIAYGRRDYLVDFAPARSSP